MLISSPAYLTYYFTQRSFGERLDDELVRAEQRWSAIEKQRESNSAYVAGYWIGRTAKTVTHHGFVVFMIALLVLAVLELQYQFVFRKLFEQDATGRRVYIVLLVVSWLIIAFASDKLIGGQVDLGWTIANWLILLNIGYSLFVSWRNAGCQKLVLTQQRTQAELDALKAQVNPHFLFNSLNNIYGTAIVENSPRTAESIQQLSGIVRYVMEESRLQTTDIQRELRFIDDYVELQRVRIPNQDNIHIEINIDWDEKPAQIVSLLLNPLIENAFKYGISIQCPCFVRINLRVQDGTLQLSTENSILPRTDLEKGTGLGLANVRKRLELAYPNRHLLTVEEANDTFLVNLVIKL